MLKSVMRKTGRRKPMASGKPCFCRHTSSRLVRYTSKKRQLRECRNCKEIWIMP